MKPNRLPLTLVLLCSLLAATPGFASEALEQQLKILEEKNQSLRSEQGSNSALLEQLASQKLSQLANRDIFLNELNQAFFSIHELARTLPVTAITPGRLQQFQALSQHQKLPSPEELQSAITALQSLVKDTGLTGPAEVSVVQPNGSELVQSVTFAGPFAVNNNGNFLIYQPDRDRLLTAPRQPNLWTRIYAAGFRGSRGDAMAIDPEHGQLLQRMSTVPTLFEQINNGGFIVWLILTLAGGGLLFIGKRLVFINGESQRIQQQKTSVDTPLDNNALGRMFQVWDLSKSKSKKAHKLRLEEAIIAERTRMNRGHSFIRTLAVLMPMLGFLGTVINLIATFQTINFDAGQEELMASCIAYALVATAAGMLAAILLLTGYGLLTTRSKHIITTLEKQAAGILAAHREEEQPGLTAPAIQRKVGELG